MLSQAHTLGRLLLFKCISRPIARALRRRIRDIRDQMYFGWLHHQGILERGDLLHQGVDLSEITESGCTTSRC
jgi:hypothetical protein